jgi:outer membrane immunogenic protein
MKLLLPVGIAAAALIAPVTTALGADLSAQPLPTPVVIPAFNWTGFYVGANVGGGWAGGNITDALNGVSFGTGTGGAFIGGGQIGYNYQISPNVVLGVEWLMDGVSSNNGSNIAFIPAFGDFFQASVNTDWITTVTGRIGITGPQWDHLLLYAKGGGAWAQDEATLTDLATGASFSASRINSGWVAGAGVEWAIAPGWSVRLEYDYIGLNGLSVIDGQPGHGDGGGGAGGGGAGGGGGGGAGGGGGGGAGGGGGGGAGGGGGGGAGGGGGGGAGGGGGGGIHGIVSDTFNVHNANVQMLTLGVQYLFNWSPAPAAPVVTKY